MIAKSSVVAVHFVLVLSSVNSLIQPLILRVDISLKIAISKVVTDLDLSSISSDGIKVQVLRIPISNGLCWQYIRVCPPSTDLRWERSTLHSW